MEKETKVAEIEVIMKNSGYRFTRAREMVVKLFVDTEDHLKPEEVHRLLRDKEISLPTVYRNIDILKKMGIIKEISIGTERVYELNVFNKKKLHMHFKCNVCEKIKEYSNKEIFKEMIRQRDYLENSFGDDIEDITVVMTGICKECKMEA